MTPDGYMEAEDWKRVKYFKPEEFACKCGCGFCHVKKALVDGLSELRAWLGMPVHINSGCRCPKHNKKVGGEPNSQHLVGAAADVTSPGHEPWMIQDASLKVKAFKVGGIGVYPKTAKRAGWVHVDVRTTGPARWEG